MTETVANQSISPLVLLCVDGLEHSTRAFNWYHKNFYRNDHIVGLVQIYSATETQTSDNHEHESRKFEAKNKTRQFQEFCTRKGINTRIFTAEKVDSVGHTICKLAKEVGADVIIMGHRGLGTIKRAIYGSVSEYVLHHTHVPVLIVPPEETSVSGTIKSSLSSTSKV